MRIIAVAFVLAITIVVGVNSFSGKVAYQYAKTHCSRYCHNTFCPHYKHRKEQGMVKFAGVQQQFYSLNIRLLRENALGLSYQEMNLLLYIFIFPSIAFLLLWGAARKSVKA